MINVNDKLIKQDLAKIGAEAFAVLMSISIHANSSQTAFPGVKRLMELSGLSRNKVYRAVNVLIENKYLERTQTRKDVDGKGDGFGITVYKVTTKYLSVWMPISDTTFEEGNDVLTGFGDTQNEYAQNGTISINKKGSINKKEDSVVCEQTTPPPTKLQTRLNCKNAKHEGTVIEIVDYFKKITGRNVEYHTNGALKLMLHWLNEGYTIADFKAVIDFKTEQFKGTENWKYISIDTFCRIDKFEDNLSKAQTLHNVAPQSEPTLADCEMTKEQATKYQETKSYIDKKFPNLKDIRFFSHREFLLFYQNDTTDFLPALWRNKATVRNLQEIKIKLMNRLNTNHWERKAAGSLYDFLKTQIRLELKKQD